ncbi:hypothetical protein [Myxococcus stipitatus]|nr:hypothetical protein [Myxococcus stipitatus]
MRRSPSPAETKPTTVAGRRQWMLEKKLRVLAQPYGVQGEELGTLLRSEGLHEAQWQER